MDKLQSLDQALFVELNSHSSPLWDTVMVLVSNKYVWFPFYLLLIAVLVYFYRRRGALLALVLAASVGLADFVSSGILKPYFGRLRPCHEEVLEASIHVINGCGGRFGFVSSHAANSFAIALFVAFLLKPNQWLLKSFLFFWALLISYSRVYLGVHYPGDILVGGVIGSLAAYLGFLLYGKIYRKYPYWQR